jgi:hypothetical protein
MLGMSIIPNPGSPPAVAPIGEPIVTNGGVTTTIAAGTQVYGNAINVIHDFVNPRLFVELM